MVLMRINCCSQLIASLSSCERSCVPAGEAKRQAWPGAARSARAVPRAQNSVTTSMKSRICLAARAILLASRVNLKLGRPLLIFILSWRCGRSGADCRRAFSGPQRDGQDTGVARLNCCEPQ